MCAVWVTNRACRDALSFPRLPCRPIRLGGRRAKRDEEEDDFDALMAGLEGGDDFDVLEMGGGDGAEGGDAEDDESEDDKDKDADVVVVDASVLVHALHQVKRWCRDGREEVVIVPLEGMR